MCGIAGAFGSRVTDWHDRRTQSMLELMRYRGPDDEGMQAGPTWALGTVRLAVRDPKHGRQPVMSACGRWLIVFNGEVYNANELSSGLASAGRTLRTHCDTEVLVEMFAARGVRATLDRLDGMFAFAAFDREEHTLWLGRDPFGEKPLFLERRAGAATFCSELGPLIATARDVTIHATGLLSILRHGHPWRGLTAVREIEAIEPGTVVAIDRDDRVTFSKYWSPPDAVDDSQTDERRVGDHLLELLDKSVRRRLISDVPLGVLLSGGLDSGAIAALAQRNHSRMSAVTMALDEPGYSEGPLARATAARVGMDLVGEVRALPAFTADLADRLIWHHGQPFADSSAIPTATITALARQHFTVALSGDGGDELLGGYVGHRRVASCAKFARVPGAAYAASLLAHFPEVPERIARAARLVASASAGDIFHELTGVFTDDQVIGLCGSDSWRTAARDFMAEARTEAQEQFRAVRDPILAASLYQLRHSLPADILTKVDRMSMAASLEVRAPFLNTALAAYALALPPQMKIRGGRGKYVLRRALERWLPRAVTVAPKKGFALPLARWLTPVFWDAVHAELAWYRGSGGGGLDADVIAATLEAARQDCVASVNYRAAHRAFLLHTTLRWIRAVSTGTLKDIAPVARSAALS